MVKNKKNNIFTFSIVILIFLFFVLLLSPILIDFIPKDRPADKIYVSEGRSFLEVNTDKFNVNRTLNISGTSVEITYDSVSGYLYTTVGATNKLYEVDTDTFQINRVFNGHTFNVQDVLLDNSKQGDIYTVSSDNTVRRINYTNFSQVDIYRGHNGSVMDAELKNGFIYAGTLDFTISRINSSDLSDAHRIVNFPEAVPAVAYDDSSDTSYYGGGLGTIYRINEENFTRYDEYKDIPGNQYNNIEFDRAPDNISRQEIEDVEERGIIKIFADEKRDVLYAGGGNGILYKIDMENLTVIDTYSVKENRGIDYNFSDYSSPSINNGSHIYNYDIRGIDMDSENKYVYITVAPGALIEINPETMEEVRKLRTTVEGRTVSLATSRNSQRP